MVNKNLSDDNYIGKVIYNEDPTYTGRCKVKVFGLMDDLDDSLIPWFSPANITTFSSQYGGGNFSVPKVGTYVRVRFANKDILSGEYTCIQNVDPNIKDLISEHYQGTHVLLYDADEELIMVFQPETGLTIEYKESRIVIDPTNAITISEPNNNAMIKLDNNTINIESKGPISVTSSGTVDVSGDVVNVEGNKVNVGKNASNHAVVGESLVTVLKTLASAIETKYPITPGEGSALSAGIDSILSGTVKVAK